MKTVSADKFHKRGVGNSLVFIVEEGMWRLYIHEAMIFAEPLTSADTPLAVYSKSRTGPYQQLNNDYLFRNAINRWIKILEDAVWYSLTKEKVVDYWNPKLPKKVHYKQPGLCAAIDNTFDLFQYKTQGFIVGIFKEGTNVLKYFLDDVLYDWVLYHDSSQIAAIKSILDDHKDEPIVATDCETYDPDDLSKPGPKGLVYWQGRLRLLQIYFPSSGKCLVIDFHVNGTPSYSHEIRKLLQEYLPHRQNLFHNALFDLGWLHYWLGVFFVDPRNVIDTMIISQNMWAGIGSMRHSLGALCNRLELEADKTLQTSAFGGELIRPQINYGADDVRLTYQAFLKLKEKMRKSPDTTNYSPAQLDNQFLVVLHGMRYWGVPICQERLHEAIDATQAYLQQEEKYWTDYSGFSGTVSTVKLLPWLIETGMLQWVADPEIIHLYTEHCKEIAIDSKAKTEYSALNQRDKLSADKKTLTTLVSHLREQQLQTEAEAIQHLLNYKVAKKRFDYLRTMVKTAEGGNRVWSSMGCLANQGMGRTRSGSFSKVKKADDLADNLGYSIGCQVHNPAKEHRDFPQLPDIRKVFKAPPEYKFIEIDLASAHARLCAYFCGIEGLKKGMQPGHDPHSFTGSLLAQSFSPGESDLTNYEGFLKIKKALDNDDTEVLQQFSKETIKLQKYYRKIAKTLIYLRINDGGAYRLLESLHQAGVTEATLDMCKQILESVDTQMPELPHFLDQQLVGVNRYDFEFDSKTLGFNRYHAKPPGDDDEDEDEDDSIGATHFGWMVANDGRARYVPRWPRTTRYGKTYYTAKKSDIAAHHWQAPEATIMKRAGLRFYVEYCLPKWSEMNYNPLQTHHLPPPVWIANMPHDALNVIAHTDIAHEAATVLREKMKEEWHRICPEIPGVEVDDIESVVFQSWAGN